MLFINDLLAHTCIIKVVFVRIMQPSKPTKRYHSMIRFFCEALVRLQQKQKRFSILRLTLRKSHISQLSRANHFSHVGWIYWGFHYHIAFFEWCLKAILREDGLPLVILSIIIWGIHLIFLGELKLSTNNRMLVRWKIRWPPLEKSLVLEKVFAEELFPYM